MTLEKVIWTTLPAGVEDKKTLKVTVHVAPRLKNADSSNTPRKLSEFAAFSNWPNRLSSLDFSVAFDGGPSFKAEPVVQADPDLWARMFPPDTPVNPFEFDDHASKNLHTFPVRGVLQWIQTTYGELGGAGADLPSIDDPTGPLSRFDPLEPITTWITDSSSFFEELYKNPESSSEQGSKTGTVIKENVADPSLPFGQQVAQNAFFQAYRFYYRPGSQRPDLPDEEPPPDIPKFDFHQMVAALADHPDILRRLGLIVDLTIELPSASPSIPSDGVVRIIPEGELPEDPPTSPGTRYQLDKSFFVAKPKNSSLFSHGLLRLSPEWFDLFQVDVDGAALQSASFANTLGRLRDPLRRSEATPSEAGAPALRSAGFSVARDQHGDQLLTDLLGNRAKNNDIESGNPVIFDAEDLVRGFRIDVFDEDAPDGARWFSLHRRQSKHKIKDLSGAGDSISLEVEDEGYIKGVSATSERVDHPNASDDLYLHETVFGWEGWSLSAPRPGKRIVEPGEGDVGSTLARHDPDAGNPHAIVTDVAVEPGTLPRLRIGRTYRLRARLVDLAGNSLTFEEGDYEFGLEDHTIGPQKYYRFEPVPSPTVLRRHLDTEGESLEHLVIRSNLEISAADYADSNEVKQALDDVGAPYEYTESSQRHLAPPKGSQLMAEQDGRFESAFGGTAAQVTVALRTALREEGTFLDEDIVDTATGQKTINQTTIEVFSQDGSVGLPANRGDGLPDGAYAYYPDENVLLPYLPDPLAIGLSLVGFDHARNEVFHKIVPFSGDWPELKPFRLRFSEGPIGAEFIDGVFEVTLPKAEVVRARLSSVFSKDRIEDLGIWDWIPSAKKTDQLTAQAVQGRHWMLTPFRWLTFTHATQQPLEIPDMTSVLSARLLGSTFALFRGPIQNHAKSTGRLDVYGEWTEDVDLLTDDEPRMRAFGTEVPHQAHAFGFDIRPLEDQAQVFGPDGRESRHEFGDTKHRRIVYHSVATTRFREFLPRPIATDLPRIQRVEPTVNDDGETTPGLIYHIPSSARPAAPDVAYVLPTFKWERDDEGDHRKHVRRGESVRVWMRRPWFSSGDGEQLAVLLEPGVSLPPGWVQHDPQLELSLAHLSDEPPHIVMQPLGRTGGPRRSASIQASGSQASQQTSPNDFGAFQQFAFSPSVNPPISSDEKTKMLQPYITSWGLDPVWKSALPASKPTVAAFPLHTGYATGLTLEELPASVKVNAVAHDVYFDRERKMWYCDIEINPGNTYFPFVRLALARYQPHSVPNAHLSRVVMTDFIQLAPHRTANIFLADGKASIEVLGYSGRNIVADHAQTPLNIPDDLVNLGGSSNPNTNVRVTLESRIPGIPGDLGWEKVGKEITLQSSTSGFYVTWEGDIDLPDSSIDGGLHRLVITETELYEREDMVPGDPTSATSPADFVRERIVYADVFEI